MKPILAVLLVLVLAAGVHAAGTEAAKSSSKGKHYPAEARTFKAAESGFEVVQLTTDAADDSGLYFTSNSFLPDDNALVFASKRSGSWNLFLIDLKSHDIVQLTDGRKISGTGSVVCAATHEVFYRDGDQIKVVSTRTLEERVITKVPAGYGVGSALSVSCSGQVLAFSITENVKLETKTAVLYSDMDEHFQKHPWSAVLTGRADGTGWHEIGRQQWWISHTLLSPRDDGPVLYCHEGRWNMVPQRLWLLEQNGEKNRPLRPEETPEIRIGHEFWFNDGFRVGYQVSYPKGKPMLGIADSRDGTFHEYELPFRNWHLQASPAGDVFVGDGNEKEPFINLFRLADGKITGEHLWRHDGAYTQQYWHPHPAFSPDGKCVVFTSSRAGNGDVYLIRLAQ